MKPRTTSTTASMSPVHGAGGQPSADTASRTIIPAVVPPRPRDVAVHATIRGKHREDGQTCLQLLPWTVVRPTAMSSPLPRLYCTRIETKCVC